MTLCKLLCFVFFIQVGYRDRQSEMVRGLTGESPTPPPHSVSSGSSGSKSQRKVPSRVTIDGYSQQSHSSHNCPPILGRYSLPGLGSCDWLNADPSSSDEWRQRDEWRPRPVRDVKSKDAYAASTSSSGTKSTILAPPQKDDITTPPRQKKKQKKRKQNQPKKGYGKVLCKVFSVSMADVCMCSQ